MIKKIYLTGPESTGKTTLCQGLASHYDCAWVPEYARQYITEQEGEYEFDDLTIISQGQAALEQRFEALAKTMLIMDTGQAVLYIWSMHKYNKVSPIIISGLAKQHDALHLLCKPDIPWQPDPLRESEGKRDLLFENYKDLLLENNLKFEVLEGQGQARVENAKRFIDNFLL